MQAPDIPEGENYVMFDLEGLPPQLDDLDKIYLWGLRVYGSRPTEYRASVAGFGEDGDRQGWFNFLNIVRDLFQAYGDIRFVHWGAYEQGRLTAYVRRHGDVDGLATRVSRSLLDLLPIVRRSLVLPIPGYSLKEVERYIGFRRSQEEYGGDWAMAKYIEAVETDDETTRQALIDQILTYNREDLEATWHVLQWLKTKQP